MQNLKISIGDHWPDQTMVEELLHEIDHAINWVADLTDASTEEDFVRRGVPIRLDTYTRKENAKLWTLIQTYKGNRHETGGSS